MHLECLQTSHPMGKGTYYVHTLSRDLLLWLRVGDPSALTCTATVHRFPPCDDTTHSSILLLKVVWTISRFLLLRVVPL